MSMRRGPILILSLILLLIAGSIPTAEAQQTQQPGPADPAPAADEGSGRARVIISLATPFSPERLLAPAVADQQRSRIAAAGTAVRDLLQRAGGSMLREYAGLPFLAAEIPSAALRVLEQSSAVATISPDELREPALIQSTAMIQATTATSAGFTGRGQAIAIIDTGVQTGHPFLAGRNRYDACFDAHDNSCPGGRSSATGPGAAEPLGGSPHGTHVAGIAVGNGGPNGMRGVAPEATYIPIRVFGTRQGAYDSDILAGLNYVYSLRNTTRIAAVNISLGGRTYTSRASCDLAQPAYQSIFSQLSAAGIAPVVAAGNDGLRDALSAPACVSGAISVGATGDTADQVQGFSNAASFLTMLAPGASITSAIPGSGYGGGSGTSMAAPHVAGSLAVMRQVRPGDSVTAMLTRITRNSPTVCNAAAPSICKPRVNLWKALELGPPSAPTKVSAASAAAAVTVSWQPPQADNGSPITGYTATARASGGGPVAGTCTATATGRSCTIPVLTTGTSHDVTVTASNAYGTGVASSTVPVALVSPATVSDYVAIGPVRIADTRDGTAGVRVGKVGPGSPLTVAVAGRYGVPGNAAAVALNVTVTQPSAAGYVTIYPCGNPRPLASNLNYTAGQTVPNAVLVATGSGGAVCAYSMVPAHIVIDLNGYLSADADYTGLVPTRLIDTRNGTGAPGVPLAAGQTLAFTAVDRAGIPAEATSLVTNVTVTEPTTAGFVTVWPCGQQRPPTSNLNYVAGQTVPNAVLAGVGDNGAICIRSTAATHLVLDVAGYLGPDADYDPLVPKRALDTRDGSGGKLRGGQRTQLQFGDPGELAAVVLNVTVTAPDGPGYVTVYPCNQNRPLASSLNYVAGQTVPNQVIAPVDSDGNVCFHTQTATHLLADLTGQFPRG